MAISDQPLDVVTTLPATDAELEDFCVAVANEIRHGRSIALMWARRSQKRRTVARVNELLGATDEGAPRL